MKTAQEVISVLTGLKPYVRKKYKVKELFLFGSVVRDENTPTSDIDLLVEFADDADLLDLSGLGLFLEDKLGVSVDVVPSRALRKELRASVEAQAVPI